MLESKRPLKVFLSYSSRDKKVVRELSKRLINEGWIDTWQDEKNLLPGQDWRVKIEEAVENSDIVIVCLSENSITDGGFVQKELRYAREIALEKPDDSIFIIPLRFNDVEVPRGLRFYQWVDYFGNKRDSSYQALINSLRTRYKQKIKVENDYLTYKERAEEIREKLEKEKAEKIRLEKEKLEKEKLEKERAELRELETFRERLTREKAEREIVEKLAIEKAEREIAEKLAIEKAEHEKRERIARKKAEREAKEETALKLEIARAKKRYSRQPTVLAVMMTSLKKILESLNSIKESYVNNGEFKQYTNPYIVGNPITPEDKSQVFIGRSDIVLMISREIDGFTQKPSLLLYGRRRMGKTSALLNLRTKIKGINVIHIYISAQNIIHRSDADLVFSLVKQVIEKLQEATLIEKLLENQEYYLSEVNYKENPVKVLSSFFHDCNNFLDNQDYNCLFMFDEYELLGETISRDFFLQMRDTMQHKTRFAFLFAGTHLPNEVSNSNWAEVFMNVKVLHISFLDWFDSYKLLTKPTSDLKLNYASKEVIYRILHVTGCQPLLLQSVASEIVVYLNVNKKNVVDDVALEYAIEKTIDRWGDNFFTYIWKNDCSTKTDRELIKKIVFNNFLIKKNLIEDYNPSIKKLRERDLLKIEDNYVKLTMPIFGLWIQRENPEVY